MTVPWVERDMIFPWLSSGNRRKIETGSYGLLFRAKFRNYSDNTYYDDCWFRGLLHACNRADDKRCCYGSSHVNYDVLFQPNYCHLSLIGLLLGLLVLRWVRSRAAQYAPIYQEAQENLVSKSMEYIRGISVLRSFSKGEEGQREVRSAFQKSGMQIMGRKRLRPGFSVFIFWSISSWAVYWLLRRVCFLWLENKFALLLDFPVLRVYCVLWLRNNGKQRLFEQENQHRTGSVRRSHQYTANGHQHRQIRNFPLRYNTGSCIIWLWQAADHPWHLSEYSRTYHLCYCWPIWKWKNNFV